MWQVSDFLEIEYKLLNSQIKIKIKNKKPRKPASGVTYDLRNDSLLTPAGNEFVTLDFA